MGSSKDPIARVAVVSTGTARVRPEHVGPTRKPMPVWLLTSGSWTEPLPINVFVVEHRDGLVLFDTGQDRAAVTDPTYFPTAVDRFVNARMARTEVGPEDTLDAQLAALGYRIGDVNTAVISHLHPDHIGGLPMLTGARIVISQREWQTVNQRGASARGVYRSHIDLPGLDWQRVTPQRLDDPTLAPFTEGFDLFGDGSMVLLPTPGHTPGSLSMLVRRPGRAPLLMVGDLTYDAEMLDAGQPSGMCDRKVTGEVMARVRALRAALPGLVILPAHDRGSADRLAAAAAG